MHSVDVTCCVIFCIYKLDLLVRLRSSGWAHFWRVPEDFYIQSKNRYDLRVSLLAAVLLLVVAIQALFGLSVDDSNSSFMGLEAWNRITIAVEGLRLFSSVERIRVIWFGMLAILPKCELQVHTRTLSLTYLATGSDKAL